MSLTKSSWLSLESARSDVQIHEIEVPICISPSKPAPRPSDAGPLSDVSPALAFESLENRISSRRHVLHMLLHGVFHRRGPPTPFKQPLLPLSGVAEDEQHGRVDQHGHEEDAAGHGEAGAEAVLVGEQAAQQGTAREGRAVQAVQRGPHAPVLGQRVFHGERRVQREVRVVYERPQLEDQEVPAQGLGEHLDAWETGKRPISIRNHGED